MGAESLRVSSISLAEGNCLSPPTCWVAELGEVRGQHPPCVAGRRDMNWPTHAGLGCHIGANWHLMVRKRFSHHIILYCKYILQALLALGFGSHMSFCLALKRQEFLAHTLAEVAGAAWLPGTQSGTAGGADVCAHGEGDGAVTAMGRGGNGVGSTTVTGIRLGEVSGAGQPSAGS